MEFANFITGSGSFGYMMVNAAAEGNRCEAISDWLVLLVILIGELALCTRVDDTFTWVSLSITQ
jgi:hypothetical protein